MMPEPLSFPPRYPRGVVLQFPSPRPMFSQTVIEPSRWLKKTLVGLMLLSWLAAAWAIALAIAVFAWRALR